MLTPPFLLRSILLADTHTPFLLISFLNFQANALSFNYVSCSNIDVLSLNNSFIAISLASLKQFTLYELILKFLTCIVNKSCRMTNNPTWCYV